MMAGMLIAAVVAGCGDDKTTNPNDKPTTFTYLPLDTPQHVVANLRDSWNRIDSVRTDQIYDDAYIGTSVDQSDNSTLTFTKTQEVQVIARMKRDANVRSASFDPKPENTWVRLSYPTDPPGWATLQLYGVNIQLDHAVYGTLLANSSSFFELKFIPTLDSASPTDTTWKIVRWSEIAN